MKIIKSKIPSSEPGILLDALRYVPEVNKRNLGVLLAHGFTSGKYSMDSAAAYLAERGYECVTYDAIGHKLGGTGGEMLHIRQSAENLRDALYWTSQNCEVSRLAVIGHSMGAAAALQAVAWHEETVDRQTQPAFDLAAIACVCMGINPVSGFDSPLGAAMLKQRSDYVAGAPARELLSGLQELLDSARHIRSTPVLLLAAKNDILLPLAAVEALHNRIGEMSTMRTVDAMHLDAVDRSRGLLYNWLEEINQPTGQV